MPDSSHPEVLGVTHALLGDIWGYDQDVGSNVVDAVIHGVRKKLGPRATMIETVRGVGYRLRLE